MPKLTKGKITKASKKYGNRFSPKYRAFNILQNNIEDVVKKSTLMWKVIYGLQTVKEGQEDPFERKNDGNDDEEEDEKEEEGEKEKDKEEVTMEKDVQKDNMATVDQQQKDQSVQDTQIPPPSRPHVTPTPIDLVVAQDVPDTFGQNINPLTIEDLKKILHQTSLQA